jgi:DNA-binding response OmpR family regulator
VAHDRAILGNPCVALVCRRTGLARGKHSHEAFGDGTLPAEATLLLLLLRRQGQVLSRTELVERVWDMNFDGGTNGVEVAVRRHTDRHE